MKSWRLSFSSSRTIVLDEGLSIWLKTSSWEYLTDLVWWNDVRFTCIYPHIPFYSMDNSVLPETITLVFSIFSLLVKIWKSDVPNVPDIRALPKKIPASLLSLVPAILVCLVCPYNKRILRVGLKIRISYSRIQNNILLARCACSQLLFSPLEDKIHIFPPSCIILYVVTA